MTRVLTALCVFFCSLFSLSGCAHNSRQGLKMDFSADFTAHYGEMELSGRLTYTGEKSLKLELLSPETLDGLTVGYRGGELSLGKNDLLCTADEAYLPANAFPSMLKTALGSVVSAAENGQLAFDGQEAQVDTPLGACMLTVDSEGIPLTLTLDEADCSMELINRSAL